MNRNIERRDFLKAAALSVGFASPFAGLAQRKRNLKIGHTGITWLQPPTPRPAANGAPAAGRGAGGPRRVDPDYVEGIFKDVNGLGFYGLELFSYQIQGMEASGGLASLIEKYNLPLISAYGGPNLLDSAQRLVGSRTLHEQWCRGRKEHRTLIVAARILRHRETVVNVFHTFRAIDSGKCNAVFHGGFR